MKKYLQSMHLDSVSVPIHRLNTSMISLPLILATHSHFRLSLTDEQINQLNFDSVQTFDVNQKPLFVNNIDSSKGSGSTGTTAHLTPSTQHLPHQHTITASVPHQPQLTTTIQMSPNMIEKSKQALEVKTKRSSNEIAVDSRENDFR